jgi:hypothetical protein
MKIRGTVTGTNQGNKNCNSFEKFLLGFKGKSLYSENSGKVMGDE